MQLVLQVKQVGIGANGLKHTTTDFSGESLVPQQGHRLPMECLT